MAAARKIYILTQDGQIKAATYSYDRAENWLGLGDLYDYTYLIPEDLGSEDNTPVSRKAQPGSSTEQTQQITQQQDKLRKNLEKQLKRFEPKSPLLQEPD